MWGGNAQAGSQGARRVCAKLQLQEFFIASPSGLILSSHATLPHFTAGSKDLVPVWLGSVAHFPAQRVASAGLGLPEAQVSPGCDRGVSKRGGLWKHSVCLHALLCYDIFLKLGG